MEILEKIYSPQKRQLFYFGILVSPILIYGLIAFLFSWVFLDFLKILYTGLIFFVFVTWLFDKYNDTKLKSYVFVTTVLLTTYVILLYPNKKYLISKTETQAIQLGQFIEKYRIEYGYYPKNLDDKFFNEAPKRFFLIKEFHVRIDSSDKNKNYCTVSYSLGELCGVYDTQSKKIFYHD
jgi:hypothetical protein